MNTSLPGVTQHNDTTPITEACRQRFRRLRALIRDERRRHRLLFLVSLIALGGVAGVAALSYVPRILRFDLGSTLWLQAVDTAFFGPLMNNVSIFGSIYWAIGSITIIMVMVTLFLGWKDGLYLLFVVVLQGIANSLIKTTIGRASLQPTHSPAVMGCLYSFLWISILSREDAAIPFAVVHARTGIHRGMVLLIGPSRIYLGAHWLSDVLAAYLLSFVILAFTIEFYLRYLRAAHA